MQRSLPFISALLLLGSPAFAQTSVMTEARIGVVAPASKTWQPPANIQKDAARSRGISACANGGKWKCILGGSVLGFAAGAFLVQTFQAKEVYSQHYGCSGFTGECGDYTICEKNCESSLKNTWIAAWSGAVVGGIGGYLVGRYSSR
jgi:hypothetical protein